MQSAALISSSPLRDLDTVTMLKYAETDKKRGRQEIKNACLDVSTSFSFYIIGI